MGFVMERKLGEMFTSQVIYSHHLNLDPTVEITFFYVLICGLGWLRRDRLNIVSIVINSSSRVNEKGILKVVLGTSPGHTKGVCPTWTHRHGKSGASTSSTSSSGQQSPSVQVRQKLHE